MNNKSTSDSGSDSFMLALLLSFIVVAFFIVGIPASCIIAEYCDKGQEARYEEYVNYEVLIGCLYYYIDDYKIIKDVLYIDDYYLYGKYHTTDLVVHEDYTIYEMPK